MQLSSSSTNSSLVLFRRARLCSCSRKEYHGTGQPASDHRPPRQALGKLLGSAQLHRLADVGPSFRPRSPTRSRSGTLRRLGSGWFFPMMPYGPWWRAHRREFWQHFHPGAITKYRPIQEKSMHVFLARVLKDPSKVQDYIQRYAPASVNVNSVLTSRSRTSEIV